ncbi:hypothetical protein H4582DRAFT_2084313 [Lactarius indigo]|nr:hypothetical protein H4582DRAFT_2084313 [Lactarius indigo]
MKIWLLLVDHTFHAMGNRFSVWTSGEEDIEDLKEKVKEKWQPDLADLPAPKLTVWKTKGSMSINHSNDDCLEEKLIEIRANPNAIEMLRVGQKLVNLELSDGETLLVQLPVPKRVHQVITNSSDDEAANAVP